MKKIILIFVILFSPFVNVEGKGIVTSVVIDGIEMSSFENDFIKINFKLVYSDMFLKVEIENKAEERIYIEWENARFDNSKVVFDDDTRLSMKNEKANEVVVANSKTHKNITGKNHILSNSISKIKTKSRIKKQDDTAVLILPIKYCNKDYDLMINLKFRLE